MIVHQEVDDLAVPGPVRGAHVAIERRGDVLGIAAVGVHQVQVIDRVALEFPVVADVGDLLAAGAGNRIGVRTFAIGQLLDHVLSSTE